MRELEAALVALSEKRLIAERLQDENGQVCALGALAKYKGREIPHWLLPPVDMEDFGVEMGVPRLVAWKIVDFNDEELPTLYMDRTGRIVERSPEERYVRVLAWVRKQIGSVEA